MSKQIRIRFDGPPGPTAGRFVEVEDDTGRSISFGEWIKEVDSDHWFLVFDDPRSERDNERTMCCAAMCVDCERGDAPVRENDKDGWVHHRSDGERVYCWADFIHEMHWQRELGKDAGV